jgi:hypothetical protein
VHSDVSRCEMLMHYFSCVGWTRCGLHKKRAKTSYAELVFLHLVGSAGLVVHYGASGA